MKPLTTSQTIAVMLVILCAWGFMSNDDYNTSIAAEIDKGREEALAVQQKDDWHHLVNWGDEYVPQTVAMGEVHE